MQSSYSNNCSSATGNLELATVDEDEHKDQWTMWTVRTIKNGKDCTVGNFDDLNLQGDLLQGIHARGYENTPLLQKAVVEIMKGNDVIINSWPERDEKIICPVLALQKVNKDLQRCQVLVLSAGGQQAEKTQRAVAKLGTHMKIHCRACHNGNKLRIDGENVRMGAHVVVGTPDRLYDMINRNILTTGEIKLFVLEEAQKMLVKKKSKDKIYNIFKTLAPNVRVVLLSTFLEEGILHECEAFLRDSYSILISKGDPIPDGIQQFYTPILNKSQKFEILYNFYKKFNTTQAIIFCNKTRNARNLEKAMREKGLTLSALHGGTKTKEREKLREKFYLSSDCTLITTDLFAIGLEQKAPMVISYDSPNKNYVYFDRMSKADSFSRGVVINFSTVDQNGAIEYLYKTKIALVVPIYGTGPLQLSDSEDKGNMNEDAKQDSNENPQGNFSDQSQILPVNDVKHFYIPVNKDTKFNVLCNLYKILTIRRAIILCNKSQTVIRLEKEMQMRNFPTLSLHEKLSVEKRKLLLEEIRSGHDGTIITTNTFFKRDTVEQTPVIINFENQWNRKINRKNRIRTDDWFNRGCVVINFVKETNQRFLHGTQIQELLICDDDMSNCCDSGNSLDSVNEELTHTGKTCNDLLGIISNGMIELTRDYTVDRFEDMNLSEDLLRVLYDCRIVKPTTLQRKAIIPCLKGRSVVIHAQPGMGKKTILSIAALQGVDAEIKQCQELVIVPTEEHVAEIRKVLFSLKGDVNVFWGVPRDDDGNRINCIQKLKEGAQVVIGTPKFVDEAVRSADFVTDHIKMLVLYESEKLLCQKFKEEVYYVCSALNTEVQIIFFMNSVTTGIWEAMETFTRDYIYIK